MIDMTLPWPPKELSPNARVHWRQKHKYAKAYRRTCGLIALALVAPRLTGKKYFWVTFCPPNRRSYDDDNLLARFKAGRDGIADGLGIDDKNFITTITIGDPVPGGAVRVNIRDYPIDSEPNTP
ncbi:hypothetical protein [Pseudomonas sp. OV546]|uniref:hypothetical protein n=1 Tax=Pseudomonas sp. OV546 TaxID=1881063 RepID=UPI0008E70AE7|nr:hypothetical protein [Pseudomonas sp. OV546]SFU97901.1 crossover junction endodeoxyribonuclease RusA [Pseudomonas sp. OV546]